MLVGRMRRINPSLPRIQDLMIRCGTASHRDSSRGQSLWVATGGFPSRCSSGIPSDLLSHVVAPNGGGRTSSWTTLRGVTR